MVFEPIINRSLSQIRELRACHFIRIPTTNFVETSVSNVVQWSELGGNNSANSQSNFANAFKSMQQFLTEPALNIALSTIVLSVVIVVIRLARFFITILNMCTLVCGAGQLTVFHSYYWLR